MSEQQQITTPFSRVYWQCAVSEFRNPRMLVFAALLIALRVASKALKIPIGPELYITVGFFVNALGSMCYGPVVALAAGAISDTLGCLLFPTGAYFFPFIFVEMMGSFLFAVFLYRAKLTSMRVILSRFSVSLVCNLILNPILLYYYYQFVFGKSYAIFSLPRVIKNLALFPIESLLLTVFLNAMTPITNQLKLTHSGSEKLQIEKRHIAVLVVLTVVSAVFVLLYYFVYLPNK